MAGRLPAGPAGKRLPAGLAAVSLSDLRDEPLVTLTPGTGLRTVLDAGCAEAGFDPRIAIDVNDLGVPARGS